MHSVSRTWRPHRSRPLDAEDAGHSKVVVRAKLSTQPAANALIVCKGMKLAVHGPIGVHSSLLIVLMWVTKAQRNAASGFAGRLEVFQNLQRSLDFSELLHRH